jgi:CubicO group peptidase (beta-lactamase class C family)
MLSGKTRAGSTVAPGKEFLYSNVAYDVLGPVVESVSGEPFAEHTSERIFAPLGMSRSTFVQPPPLRSDVAVTYRFSMDQQTIVPVALLLDAPAAGLTSTATDMVHFMIAQLGDGRYADVRILEAAAVREMHREQFSYAPDQPGMTFGFRQAVPPGLEMDSATPRPVQMPCYGTRAGGPGHRRARAIATQSGIRSVHCVQQ